MIQGLLQHYRNVFDEGMTYCYYLHALSQQCARTNRLALADDVYIVP